MIMARFFKLFLFSLAYGSPLVGPAVVSRAEQKDLDLSHHDGIASRFQQEQREAASFLKGGIETRNVTFNRPMDRIEQVAIATRDPLLLMGPTGAGKSRLARRIFELKKSRHTVKGDFVDVNCATLRGDGAMSTLFGHSKDAFTGALKDRPGLLRTADVRIGSLWCREGGSNPHEVALGGF